MNYTYILECKDGTYYTGWTNNLDKRIQDHNEGKGAKYTKSRLPVSLIYYEEFQTKEEAMRREYAIKCMTRGEKGKLISEYRERIGVQTRAGSVVTKDIPDWSVSAGNPCKVKRMITEEDKRLLYKNEEIDEIAWKDIVERFCVEAGT